jgi:hypothetical protein
MEYNPSNLFICYSFQMLAYALDMPPANAYAARLREPF